MEDFIWAIDEDGKPTKCKAKPENRGKRNCKHRFHQRPDQSVDDFLNEHGVNSIFKRESVVVFPYRMQENEKEKLLKINTKKDLEKDCEDGAYLELDTPVWNDMDKNYFCEKFEFNRKNIDEILREDKYMVIKGSDKIPMMTPINESEIENVPEDVIVSMKSGVEGLNEVAASLGFEATKDVYVIPMHMRQGVESNDGTVIDSQETASYKHLFNTKTNPKRAQIAYEQLINNNTATRPRKEGVYKVRSISDMFPGKKGLWRNNITGYSIPYSGRAVVSPTLDVSYDEIGIPASMAVDIFRPNITKNLKNHGFTAEQISEIYKDAKKPQTEVSKFTNNLLERAMAEENVRAIMNRQPTLHSASMIGFKPKISGNATVRVNPLVTKGYNMDFDGDSVAIYGINSSEMSSLVDKELGIENFKNTPKKQQEVLMRPTKDSLLGIMNILKHRD